MMHELAAQVLLVSFLVALVSGFKAIKHRDDKRKAWRYAFGCSVFGMLIAGASVENTQTTPQASNTTAKKRVDPKLISKPSTAIEKGPFEDASPTCGSIIGKSKNDLSNVKLFCREGIPEGVVVGAYSMEMMLWVKVNQETAHALSSNTLRSENIIRAWMKGWKKITRSEVVTIYVEWGDIEIAKGQTTAFSGDEVTFRK